MFTFSKQQTMELRLTSKSDAYSALLISEGLPGPSGSGSNYWKPSRNNSWSSVKRMLRRLLKPSTLDWETAAWELFYSIVSPKKMYRSHYYRQSYNLSYGRDDPSFYILMTTLMSLVAILWSIVDTRSIGSSLKLILRVTLLDLYLLGVIIATASWIISNKTLNNSLLIAGGVSNFQFNYISWSSCFDIHCSSFGIVWFMLYLVLFLLSPLLREESFFSIAIGNTLFTYTIAHYLVSTFYGFNIPLITLDLNYKNNFKSVQKLAIVFLTFVLFCFWIVSIACHFHIARLIINIYFSY